MSHPLSGSSPLEVRTSLAAQRRSAPRRDRRRDVMGANGSTPGMFRGLDWKNLPMGKVDGAPRQADEVGSSGVVPRPRGTIAQSIHDVTGYAKGNAWVAVLCIPCGG